MSVYKRCGFASKCFVIQFLSSGNFAKLVDETLQSHLGYVVPRTGGELE